MHDKPGVKAILGYDIVEGVSVVDYERWLADVHFPDLLTNPHLDRIVANDVVRPITASSSGSSTTSETMVFYRMAELHFTDHDAYQRYLDWFVENPIDPSRGPAGRTEFYFYLLADTTVIDRDHPYQPPISQE
jgi:hypothetical protein